MAEQGVFFMEAYRELQQFESKENLNDHIKAVRERFADELNRTANAVLDYLASHATNVLGVAYVKAATIAEGIGKSYRTATTATKLLSDLGIIEKQEIMRKKNGGNGANIYILKADCLANCLPNCLPSLPTVEEPTELTAPKSEQLQNEGLSLSFNSLESSLKSLNKKSEKAAPAIVQVELFSNIPDRIKHSLSLLSDNKLGNDIWRKVVQAYVQSDLYNTLDNVHLQAAISDNDLFYANLVTKIHNVVYAQAHGNVRTDVLGFIYSTCKGFFNDEAAAIIEDNAPEIEYDDFFSVMMERVERLTPTAQLTAQQTLRPYERSTAIELNELGIY